MTGYGAWLGKGKIRGRVCEGDSGVLVWWAWRRTGRTMSGTAGTRDDALSAVRAAMAVLA